MAQPAPNALHRFLPRPVLPLAGVAFALLGLALGHTLTATPLTQVPDLTLRLAALLCAPLPPLVLQLLTTPPNLATRRLLGESASHVTIFSRREVLRWTLVVMLAPLTLAVYALTVAAPDVLHVAAVLAGVVPLTAGLALAGMLHGLRLMAGGRHAGWAAVSGGGAFGPAESAPLLYLPAFALVGALAPVAFLTAVWNARPEWLTPTIWLSLPVVGVLLGARIALASFKRTRPHLHAGLRAAEQAHATRFTQADGLDAPPIWLTLGRPTPILQFFARAWHRRWPLSGIVTVALGVGTALLTRQGADMALLVTCAGFAAVAYTRVLSLQDESAWPASAWLGVDRKRRQRAYSRLGWGLTVPVLALGAILVWRGQGAIALSLGLGAAIGWSWMVGTMELRDGGRAPGWIRLGAWLTYGVGLIAAILGAK
jgi:hypothetical protein